MNNIVENFSNGVRQARKFSFSLVDKESQFPLTFFKPMMTLSALEEVHGCIKIDVLVARRGGGDFLETVICSMRQSIF